MRGRSSGKTGPPGNGFTPVRGGAKIAAEAGVAAAAAAAAETASAAAVEALASSSET